MSSSSFKISLVNLPCTASKQWSIAIGVTFFIYLSVVRAIRWRRYNSIHRKYEHKFLQGERLSPEEAQEIMHTSAMYDMPLLMNYALSFALFKTYAIPSISQILSDTKELKSVEGMSKRYADTELLISTWVFCPISGRSQESPLAQSSSPETRRKGEEVTVQVDDPRAMIALARVNWLHSKYPITNDDYLYTLGLFIFEPVDWTNTYGWRGLSLMESHAFFIFWVEIGRRMGIKDIPESPESFRQWIMEYETKVMVPAQTNYDVATYTTEELLHAIPKRFGMKSFARKLTICALDDNATLSINLPTRPFQIHPPHLQFHPTTIFCLPRSQSNPGGGIVIPLDKASDARGPAENSKNHLQRSTFNHHLHRSHPKWFQARPWYMPIPNNLFNKSKIWISLKLGLYDVPPGPNLRSEGYRLEEMGPVRFEQHGQDEVMRKAEEMYGCPITGPFSRRGYIKK